MKQLSIVEELKALLEAEGMQDDASQDIAPEPEMSNPTSPRLKVDVNPNPTKKGIKVQFILPKGYTVSQKEELTQKLKEKRRLFHFQCWMELV